jgi:hypothetical protein
VSSPAAAEALGFCARWLGFILRFVMAFPSATAVGGRR